MKLLLIIGVTIFSVLAEETRLDILSPNDAQQIIDKQDLSLKYAPKIDSNVPALRYLGNVQHEVNEDIYLARQFHGQDGVGGYVYGYSVPDIAKAEKKKAGGDLKGAYSYINGDGQEIKVEYWDDGTGFHQVDNLPKVDLQANQDTPEVRAAKEEHLRLWHQIADEHKKYNPNANNYDSSNYNEQQEQYNYYNQPQPQYHQQPYNQIAENRPQPQYQQAPHQQQPAENQLQPQYHQQSAENRPQPQYQQAPHQQQPAANQPQPQYQQAPHQQQPAANQPQPQYQQAPHQQQPAANQPQPQYQQQPQYQERRYEEEEEKSDPRGFFYSYDYPVGIIVNKGRAVGGPGLKQEYQPQPQPQQQQHKRDTDLYNQNRALLNPNVQEYRRARRSAPVNRFYYAVPVYV